MLRFAEGLLAASRTRLTYLHLHAVRIGNGGLAALAGVIRAGRFERLDKMVIGYNAAVTDEGLFALARAIKAAGPRGLPLLSHFVASGLQHRVSICSKSHMA